MSFVLQQVQIKARERIQCPCGVSDADADPEDHTGLWVQCDACLVWQHGTCVGLARAPRGELPCMRPRIGRLPPCEGASPFLLDVPLPACDGGAVAVSLPQAG